MPEDDTAPLENLRERLYTNKAPEVVPQPLLHEETPPAPSAWEHQYVPLEVEPRLSWSVKFLIIAVVFFITAGSVAAYLLLGGSRSVSSDHIDIVPTGPLTIASGEEVALTVSIRNNNPEAMTDATLIVTLPKNTRDPLDTKKPLGTYTTKIGDVPSGGQVSRNVSSVMFGEQNQVLSIPIRLQYHRQGSTALFTKDAVYSLTITSSPIHLEVSALTETTSGQTFAQVLTVRSDATKPIGDVGISVTYPRSGYTPTELIPNPTAGSFWNLGTFAPGEKKMITIRGVLSGQESEERAFLYAAGTVAPDGGNAIDLPYTNTSSTVTIRKPFLSTSLSLNHDSSDSLVVPAGMPIDALISWQNSLSAPISDAQISIKFSGSAIDLSSIRSQSGFYRSSDATLLFSKDSTQSLSYLGAGDTGAGGFSFSPKSASALGADRSPAITLTISIAGKRIGQGDVPEKISSTVTRTVQVATSVKLSSRIVHVGGPIPNTGPIPPKPNQETTYTVILQANNSISRVGGGTVSMILPSYVRFTGKLSPAGSLITYNDVNRMVTWNVGEIPASGSTQAAFQVSFLPSASQSGAIPMLVGEQTFTGTDGFTKQKLTTTAPALTTQLTTDPTYSPSAGVVAK